MGGGGAVFSLPVKRAGALIFMAVDEKWQMEYPWLPVRR
jgi:hypothetical protein